MQESILQLDKQKKWSIPIEKESLLVITEEGVLLLKKDSSQLIKYDKATGKQLAKFQLPNEFFYTTLTYSDSSVYVSSATILHKIDNKNLSIIWSKSLPENYNDRVVERCRNILLVKESRDSPNNQLHFLLLNDSTGLEVDSFTETQLSKKSNDVNQLFPPFKENWDQTYYFKQSKCVYSSYDKKMKQVQTFFFLDSPFSIRRMNPRYHDIRYYTRERYTDEFTSHKKNISPKKNIKKPTGYDEQEVVFYNNPLHNEWYCFVIAYSVFNNEKFYSEYILNLINKESLYKTYPIYDFLISPTPYLSKNYMVGLRNTSEKTELKFLELGSWKAKTLNLPSGRKLTKIHCDNNNAYIELFQNKNLYLYAIPLSFENE